MAIVNKVNKSKTLNHNGQMNDILTFLQQFLKYIKTFNLSGVSINNWHLLSTTSQLEQTTQY